MSDQPAEHAAQPAGHPVWCDLGHTGPVHLRDIGDLDIPVAAVELAVSLYQLADQDPQIWFSEYRHSGSVVLALTREQAAELARRFNVAVAMLDAARMLSGDRSGTGQATVLEPLGPGLSGPGGPPQDDAGLTGELPGTSGTADGQGSASASVGGTDSQPEPVTRATGELPPEEPS